jgi:tetratricopeptide (TPR) repeat protein
MELTSTIELEGHLIAHREAAADSPSGTDQITALSAWMVVLGTVRMAYAMTTYAMAAFQTVRLSPTSIGRWTLFFGENPPIFLLGSAWPLFLGLALRRTRWPELLKAGALTFSILSVGGLLSMVADWGDGRARWIGVGSFHIAREALAGQAMPVLLIGALGAAQLLLEFATAVRAALLAYRNQGASPADSDRHALGRRLRFGRMAVLLSLGFLIVMVRLPAWSAFVEVLNQSRMIREFILRDDLRRIHSTRGSRPSSPEAMRVREVEMAIAEASQAWSSERYAQARDNYQRLIATAETIPQSSLSSTGRYVIAQAYNGWAWLLATCPDAKLRSADDAVAYARRAIELVPNDREIWNTLGVAYYRLGNWEEARSALYRSMELSDEGDANDWFFLAMIHAKFDHQERAHDWYDKAVQWSHQTQPGNGELYRFQVEAAEVLGLPKPERIPTPPRTKSTRSLANPMHPGGMPPRRSRGQSFNPTPVAN